MLQQCNPAPRGVGNMKLETALPNTTQHSPRITPGPRKDLFALGYNFML